jgi:cytosine/adenosine deaminase-related metal-dependent hydrolase
MILRARWVLPIDRAPVPGGWIHVAGGRIAAMGTGRPPAAFDDLGDVALLPGLVNAHTHLELSWMAGRVPPSGSMDEWIRTLLDVRRAGPPGGAPAIAEAMARAAVAMHASGTVLVGDVSNTLVSPAALAEADLGGMVFHELIGFDPVDPAQQVKEAWDRVARAEQALSLAEPEHPRTREPEHPIVFSVVAHAPYSVAPSLFAEIVRRAASTRLSIHLAESVEEVEFLRTGLGPIREMLEALGVWTGAWRAPGSDPVRYVADLGYLQPGVLIVHGVHLTDDGLERLRAARAVLVTCPRSNRWVGSGSPRLAHFYASRMPVAIGTDSLASVPTLNLFDELAEMRRIAPEVSASALLDSATRRGADALGFGHDYGTLAPGKRAALVAVEVPAATRDVEEYLVGGVPAAAIRRVA